MMKPAVLSLVVGLLSAPLAFADVYMHNPRGSNDRNCERNVNRNNGNRLFDSQNNNNGGYACERPVGNEDMQNENGDISFEDVDTETGETTTFTQHKKMYYYEGSVLAIEWTDQHGCGTNSKVACEIVLQYACEDTLDPQVDNFWPWITNKAESTTTFFGKQHFRSDTNIAAPRDGIPRDSEDAATDTIPDSADSAIPSTVETRRFGMHESYDYYQTCQRTERNKGLYTADQRMRRNDRRATRQNPNGNRNGLECPEERDYYPWWAPSPWVDIAILTDSGANKPCFLSNYTKCTKRCQYYLDNTFNYNKKGYCDVNRTVSGATVTTKVNNQLWASSQWYNNKEACEAPANKGQFEWYEVSLSDKLTMNKDSFVCAKTQFSRVNQLGNGHADDVVSSEDVTGALADHAPHGVNANRFLWTMPTIPTASTSYFADMKSAYKTCTLRMRYNISTGDFQYWPQDANDAGAARMVDYRNNSITTDDPNTPLLQDPYIYIGPGQSSSKDEKFVSLAVNTNQYGRTFQDRSYSFSIVPLPTKDVAESTKFDTPAVSASTISANLANGGKIYNVNVRGKRGNIVQTYPSVEYDFVPNALALSEVDMIHFQWTGSDYNPRRGCNNGEGGPPDPNTFSTDPTNLEPARADRSNVVLLDAMSMNVPKDYSGYDNADIESLTYTQRVSFSKEAILENAPCYDAATDTTATRDACYNALVRLAYLNQQLDGGSLVLRGGKACLTQAELDAMPNQDLAEIHPLNCAKLNAKVQPYFDGGVMSMSKAGKFPFFSSRNNNFSNRNQAGIICVGDCPVDPLTGVLQDINPATGGTEVQRPVRVSASTCVDTQNSDSGANANGATSCVVSDPESDVLTEETFTTHEGDNDALGDGQETLGCEVLTFVDITELKTIEQQITLAIILLFVGLFTAWLAYFLYNRYLLHQANKQDHRGEVEWAGNKTEMVAGTNPSKDKEIREKSMI